MPGARFEMAKALGLRRIQDPKEAKQWDDLVVRHHYCGRGARGLWGPCAAGSGQGS